MKKLLCVLLCFIFAVGLIACGEEDTSSEEIRILDLAKKPLLEEIDFKIVDEDGKAWLDNDDVENVYVTYEKSKNRYLELRLTKSGAKEFKKAIKKGKGELSITVDGQKLVSPVIQDDIEENSAIVLGEYEDIMIWFNAIT